jgi:hypothetical protein
MSNAERSSSPFKDSFPSDALIDQRYLVQGMLGRGGMGYVYRVFDTARERVIALKQLSLTLGRTGRTLHTSQGALSESGRMGQRTAMDARKHTQRMALFRREFHTLAELAHPHIISAYDYGFHEGQPYYTMELLTGADISRHVPLAWPKACVVLRDVASALSLLHMRRLLHRDISPSNVHQQLDGSIKLIDFGAMGPMGGSGGIVGTPPFIAPEVLRQEVLDTRTDLYSLGALGFYLLTGRTVYPARTVAELCDFIGMRPSPVSNYAELPAALDQLILQLLSHERGTRPDTTTEVIERLNALAGLESGGRSSAGQTFVVAPSLVARRQQLDGVRRASVRARHGKGASIVLAGPQGSGRSRLLEACALEGKLSGALVLRVDPEPREAGPLATWRVLLQQLHRELGVRERRELSLPKLLAEGLLAGFDWDGRGTRASDNQNAAPLDVAATSRELRAFITQLAERRALFLAVDDVERLDSASIQLLTALASRAHAGKLLLVTTLDSELAKFGSRAEPRAATSASEGPGSLLLHSRKLSLAPLTLSETEALLATVFGDLPNLAGVAHRVHALSAGNARMTVELAQHLIDGGAIRREGATFVLPEALSTHDLPDSVGGVLRARVARLSQEAQTLCLLLALTNGMPVSVEESFALSELSPSQGESALTELLASFIAERHATGLGLRQTTMAEAVAAGLDADKKRALHARIAALADADPQRRMAAAEHYFGADLPLRAVDVLLAAAASENAGRGWHANYRQLIERGVEMCEAHGRPARDAFLLRRSLAQQILNYHEPCERAQLLSIHAELCRMSGLSDWQQLSHISDPAQRLQTALAHAQARYTAAPEHERVLPPSAAIPQLVSYSSMLAGFASSALDVKLLRDIPSLAPLAPLSPSIALIETLIQSLRHLRAGRTERYLEGNYQILQRLEQPDSGGFGPAEARGLRVGLLYGVALTQAVLGREIALTHAAELDAHSHHVINAWRARQIVHMFRCDPAAADAARQQIELLQLQQGTTRQFHQGTTLEGQFLAFLFAEDLLSLRRILPALEQQAERHPNWSTAVLLAQATLQRVRGRPDAAIVLYEQLLASTAPGHDTLWGMFAAGHVYALVDAGQLDEARERGLAYVQGSREHELVIAGHRLELALAIAESALGEHEQASARLARVSGEIDAAGFRGLHRGAALEVGARLALARKDAASYERYYAECSQELGMGAYPAIAARLQRLQDRAEQLGLSALPPGVAQRQLSEEEVRRELAQCGAHERPGLALTLALRATGAESGYLYLLTDSGLQLGASASPLPPPAQLAEVLAHYVASAEVLSDQTVDITCHTSFGEADAALEPLLLRSRLAGERAPVAVLALRFPGGRRWPAPQLMDCIGAGLGRRGSRAEAEGVSGVP